MHFDELLAVLRSTESDIRVRYTELYRILCLVLSEATAGSSLTFSGPFARLTFLATELRMSDRLRQRLNACRGRCRELATEDDASLQAALPHDVRAVAELLSLVADRPIPASLLGQLPRSQTVPFESRRRLDYMRVCVLEWDEATILAQPDDELAQAVRIACASEDNRLGKWDYVLKLVSVGTQLNLIRAEERDGLLYPEIIIVEPDYLVDISAVAACFAEHGASAYLHLLRRFQPSPRSLAILLGNMAGQMLDDEVNRRSAEPVPYRETALRFMHRYAIELATTTESLQGFHKEAMEQQQNIRQLLQAAASEDSALRMDHLLIEPSFFCEMLGLQGRMDLMQDDFRVLMEQKSGKRDFLTQGHREPHYVQMLLYQAVLHYGFGLRNDQISSYLLYSKYPDGLLREGPAPHLLFEALRLRNQMVFLDFSMSRGGSHMLDRLTPDRLNTRGVDGRLWTEFQRPQIEALLRPVHEADALSRAYFHRMTTFVAREHQLSKIGTPGREASGMASLWNSSMEEKLVAGNLFADLTIAETWSDDGSESVDRLLLRRPAETHDYLPNFRQGDIVLLYDYAEGDEPDVRRAIVSRAHIVEITTQHILLQLRATQRNLFFFQPREGRRWAVEHDSTEASFTSLYRSVYSLFSATERRRQLILAQREPEVDTEVTLHGDYSQGGHTPHFNQLVLQARQARDCFILIGPPGTGKTSFGLMNILREELLDDEASVLLLSYTNRAVDEICSKLAEDGLPFLRISSEQTCPEAFRPQLLSEVARGCSTTAELRERLTAERIVVATTTSMTAQMGLFALRRFSLAIIDEASQILEPHLLGLLCARHGEHDAIGRFVLVGDHKQLPAVVQQEPTESAVVEPELRQIGLLDCRESLFQRLLRLLPHDSPFVFRFDHQGRMHPDVARFANLHFYGGRLQPVPLPHQTAPLHFDHTDPADPMQQLLAHQRVLFLPAERPPHSESPKVNENEATLIAQAARAVYRLCEQNGRPFSPLTSLGIIVPYRHQIAVVRKHIAQYGIDELNQISIDTVERYQGSQRDVIIYGFTVQMPHQLDFLCAQSFQEDGQTIDRRLNVALTRAREQMVLIGNPELLALNPVLRDITML